MKAIVKYLGSKWSLSDRTMIFKKEVITHERVITRHKMRSL